MLLAEARKEHIERKETTERIVTMQMIVAIG